jgi:hypothetical protein
LINCDIIIADSQKILGDHVRESFLNAHNRIRDRHKIQRLEWDYDLAEYAKEWSRELAHTCSASRSDNEVTGYGENVYQNWGSRVYTPRQIVFKWVGLREDEYHQIVHPETRKLGCSLTVCKDRFSYATAAIYVCEYYPKF